MNTTPWKEILALSLATLLLICLLRMPYGYYQFVRLATTAAMVVLCIAHADKNKILAVVFGAVALLFQPFIKVALGRTIWNAVDVILAIFLIAYAAILYFKEK